MSMVDWEVQAEVLRTHGLTAQASLSGLTVWLPRSVFFVEAAALLFSVPVLVGATSYLAGQRLEQAWKGCRVPGLLPWDHDAACLESFQRLVSANGVLRDCRGAIVVGAVLLVAAIMGHIIVGRSARLRRRLGQTIALAPRSLKARGQTIAYEEIARVAVVRWFIVARWLVVWTHEGQRLVVGSDDRPVRLAVLEELVAERVAANAAALERAGHDAAAAVRPPADLERLRGR